MRVFYINNRVICKERVLFSLPIWILFFFFFCSLISVAKTSKLKLNNNGKSGHLCLVPTFRGKAFNFSPLRIIIAVSLWVCHIWDFPGGSDGKASVYNAGVPGSIPGLGRSAGEGNGNPLQYYCLENTVDRGAW